MGLSPICNQQTSFHPEMALFPNFGVNLRRWLCDVQISYASAQRLDFLELGKNVSFLDWKLASAHMRF
jgi:hypothetical protein